MDNLTAPQLFSIAAMALFFAVIWYFLGDWLSSISASLAFIATIAITAAAVFSLLRKE